MCYKLFAGVSPSNSHSSIVTVTKAVDNPATRSAQTGDKAKSARKGVYFLPTSLASSPPLIPSHSITQADKVVGNTEDNAADNAASKSVTFADKVTAKSTGKGIAHVSRFSPHPRPPLILSHSIITKADKEAAKATGKTSKSVTFADKVTDSSTGKGIYFCPHLSLCPPLIFSSSIITKADKGAAKVPANSTSKGVYFCQRLSPPHAHTPHPSASYTHAHKYPHAYAYTHKNPHGGRGARHPLV